MPTLGWRWLFFISSLPLLLFICCSKVRNTLFFNRTVVDKPTRRFSKHWSPVKAEQESYTPVAEKSTFKLAHIGIQWKKDGKVAMKAWFYKCYFTVLSGQVDHSKPRLWPQIYLNDETRERSSSCSLTYFNPYLNDLEFYFLYPAYSVFVFSSFQSHLVSTWQLASQKKLCVFYRGSLKKTIKNFLQEN